MSIACKIVFKTAQQKKKWRCLGLMIHSSSTSSKEKERSWAKPLFPH
jgi:hypothetical protein